ncbi:hypothetical protein KI387_030123, partial [Taxus chinensis]
VHFKEEAEEVEELQLEHMCLEKEKRKLVYVIDGEEVESLDVNHSVGIHEVVNNTNTRVRAYHDPLQKKK